MFKHEKAEILNLDLIFNFKVKIEIKYIISQFLNILWTKGLKSKTKNNIITLRRTDVKCKTLTIFFTQGQNKTKKSFFSRPYN